MAASTDAGASTPLPASSGALAASSLAAYSGFALPLTMLALPVYVLVPPFYAEATGLALSTIGAILLATRLLDAFVDPLLGGWIDRARGTYLRPLLLAVPVMAGGFVVLFAPPSDLAPLAAGAWLALALTCTTLGYSLATIASQAWGARLADHDAGRARVTAWREACGLAGVVLASLLSTWGAPTLIALFLGTLALALAALVARAPRTPPALAMGAASPRSALSSVFAQTRFRWLLAIFVANGVAAAVPATLVRGVGADGLHVPGPERSPADLEHARHHRCVREQVAILFDGDTATGGRHHDRLHLALLHQRPPGVDIAAHVVQATILVVQVIAQRAAAPGRTGCEHLAAVALQHADCSGVDIVEHDAHHASGQDGDPVAVYTILTLVKRLAAAGMSAAPSQVAASMKSEAPTPVRAPEVMEKTQPGDAPVRVS